MASWITAPFSARQALASTCQVSAAADTSMPGAVAPRPAQRLEERTHRGGAACELDADKRVAIELVVGGRMFDVDAAQIDSSSSAISIAMEV